MKTDEIDQLCKNASEADDSVTALQFSQAALNIANARTAVQYAIGSQQHIHASGAAGSQAID